MSDTETDVQPEQMALERVAFRCTEETERFFQGHPHDDRFCFELFRRALADGNQRAWERVYIQYRPMVAGWVKAHPSFHATGDEVQHFINRAFESMWRALESDTLDRFSNLRTLLSYLKSCVHTEILMVLRKSDPPITDMPKELAGKGRASVERKYVQKEQRQQVWEAVAARLRDEKEYLVVEAYFILDLKPREIYALYSDTFQDVQEIYRIKQNFLERMRRDPEIQRLGEEHT
ncbi:MAG: hypothetical protein M3220_20515 [Chloroflexota bacterium]|nr:hypothetical protein [Chloroflexota bacterium]